MLNKSAFSVKANANVENTIEFTVKVTGRLNKVTSFNIYIATANATYNKEFPAKYSGQAYVKNALVATNTFDGKIYQEVLKELEAPADKIEKVEIPFETKYLADQSLTAGQRIGKKVTSTTYQLNEVTGEITATTTTKITDPVSQVVKHSPTGEIAFQT